MAIFRHETAQDASKTLPRRFPDGHVSWGLHGLDGVGFMMNMLYAAYDL